VLILNKTLVQILQHKLALKIRTSNFSKAHVTSCHLGNQCTACNKTTMRLEELPKFEAAIQKTP